MGQQAGPHLVVGTAGHIDHGKTTLVRALTGVDTDRLPEEKRRGITIVLGFAPLDLPSGLRVGVIDAPGHERFVKTMVAGAGGIDLALLVVAADEGVMPQTREHLEILTLLGVERGVVALTKVDRAAGLIDLAEEDVRAALSKSRLASAPIIRVSAQTGLGIAELKEALDRLAQSTPRRAPGGPAFLPIDRAFNVKGFGAVVTGTLLSGRIAVGDELELLPPLAGRSLARAPKVRGLHVFGEPVELASAGQRVAVNLAGVELEQIALGQALMTPGAVAPTRRLTVRLEHLASHDRPLRTGSKGLFAIGTKEIEAGLTLLEVDQLMPGERGYATIRLAGPIVTLPNRRFIWRSFEQKGNAGRTIAGGAVLDPAPGRRRRKTEETTAVLAALDAHFTQEGALGPAIAALVAEGKAIGAGTAELSRRLDATPVAIQKAAAKAQVIKAQDRWISPEALEALGKRIKSAISAFHAEQPFRAGLPLAELTSRVGRRATPATVECGARSLIEDKAIAVGPEGYRLPSHRPQLELDPEKKRTVLAALTATPLEPPTGKELEAKTGLSQKSLIDLLTALAKTGEVIHAGLGLHFERGAFDDAKLKLAAHVEAHGAITTAEAKTLYGISRKYLIPLLEAFDKRGFTIRQGESRKVKKL